MTETQKCDVVRERMIPRAMTELDTELDALSKLLEVLGNQLEAVMVQIPDPPTEIKEAPKLRGECEIATLLDNFAGRVIQSRHRIAGYINRLEV